MNRRTAIYSRAFAIMAACSLHTAFADAPAPNPPSYQLRYELGTGDVAMIDDVFELNLNIHSAEGAALALNYSTSNREEEQYTERILATEAKMPSALRRYYSHYRDIDTDDQGKHINNAFEGHSYTVRRHNGQVTVSADSGKLDAKQLATLKDALDNEATRYFYPPHALAPGDTWTSDINEFTKTFSGSGKATLQGKFVELTTYHGLQCAKIHFDIHCQGRLPDTEADMTMELSGDLLQLLNPQRPLTVTLSGPITVKGTTKINNAPYSMNGQGNAALKITMIKLADKPIGSP